MDFDRDLILEMTEFNYRNNIGFWGGCILIYLKDIFIENGDIQVIYLIGSDKIEDCTDMSWCLIKMDEYKIRLREKQFKKLGI
jgi:hypothetical protein